MSGCYVIYTMGCVCVCVCVCVWWKKARCVSERRQDF
jgi:hypothetical protein